MTNIIRVRATDPADILAPAVELAVYSPEGALIEAFQFDDWLSWGDALLSTERLALAPRPVAVHLAPCSVCGSTTICCGDADAGLCREHCKTPHESLARLAHVAANSR